MLLIFYGHSYDFGLIEEDENFTIDLVNLVYMNTNNFSSALDVRNLFAMWYQSNQVNINTINDIQPTAMGVNLNNWTQNFFKKAITVDQSKSHKPSMCFVQKNHTYCISGWYSNSMYFWNALPQTMKLSAIASTWVGQVNWENIKDADNWKWRVY